MMNGIYPVAKSDTREEARIGVMQFCSPARYARINVVARAVLVIPTFIAAAIPKIQI